jgi:hypothetical protein
MRVDVSADDKVLDCELCIVGAGYAALNGLNAAAKYLMKGDRVVLVDKNETWGGQWLRQYDFVRLHQPYRMFTAGDQPWALARDPSYLATRLEVLDHLASVPAVSASHLEVQPLFGHVYRGHRLREGRAEIDATPVADRRDNSKSIRVRAKRLLKATGLDIEMLRPFPISSTKVRSVGVADPVLTTPEFLESRAPVYVIGSGKTAMDAILYIATRSRSRRPLSLITGSGMFFFVRETMFPRGPRRYALGTLPADCFLDVASAFDGSNETSVIADLERRSVLMNVFGQGGNCRFGILSSGERDEIKAVVTDVFRGHLVDVDGTSMTVREGKALRQASVVDGSWFINCTSHFRHIPHEPVLQDGGVTCAPQYAMGFTGTTAYFITHLWFHDQLAAVAPELFRVRFDVEPKLRFTPQVCVMIMANLALAGARLPTSITAKFEGDQNKWYPLPRQVPVIARVLATRGKVIRKAEKVLTKRFSDAPDPN